MTALSRQLVRLGALLALAMTASVVRAAPGDVLFSDDFNRASLAPWTTTNASRSGILNGGQVSSSPPGGAYTRRNVVTVTSPTFSATVPEARLEIWVRRGSDAFSEDPNGGENLVLEYRRADGSWAELKTYAGGGTPGQIFDDAFILPADARHGTLALRLRQTGGSGVDWDYWHFDDIVVTELAPAGPLGVGQCDDFESGLSANWNINASSGFAGADNATSSSPDIALFLNGGVVEVRSNTIDTSPALFGDLSVWIRRGSDNFSENPDGAENLVVEYLDDVGSWVTLETFTGAGAPGQIFVRSYDLPPSGRHTGFQVRFRQTGGSGEPWDYWHIDDVCFEEAIIPILQVTKIAQTLSDPVNGTTSPKAIPGAIVRYTVSVTNLGPGAVDAGSLQLTDPLPASAELYVSTLAGDPITLTDGPVVSGLGFNYASDVTFSNQPGGGPPYNYTPAPDGDGYDANITGFRINPSGAMNGASGGSTPSFNVQFSIRLE